MPPFNSEKEMPLLDHLDELRRRLIVSLVSIAILAAISYIFSGKILEFLSRPIGRLYFFSLPEAFMARVKVSLALGLVLSTPILLYEVWRFVSPALKVEEKKYVYPAIFFSTLLFLLGILFGYYLILPIGIKFLLGFGSESLQGLLGVSRYLSFLLFFLLSFGLVFELPVVVFFLTKIGVLSPKLLRQRRREAIILIFIAAAVLTPSIDLFTQLMMAIPLLILYEISIFVSYLARKSR